MNQKWKVQPVKNRFESLIFNEKGVLVASAMGLEHEKNSVLISKAPEMQGMLKDAELQLSRLTGEALEAYCRTFAVLAAQFTK